MPGPWTTGDAAQDREINLAIGVLRSQRDDARRALVGARERAREAEAAHAHALDAAKRHRDVSWALAGALRRATAYLAAKGGRFDDVDAICAEANEALEAIDSSPTQGENAMSTQTEAPAQPWRMPEQHPTTDLMGVKPVVTDINTRPYDWYHAIVLTLDQHVIGHKDGVGEWSRIEGRGITLVVGEAALREVCETILARLDDQENPLPRPRLTYDSPGIHGGGTGGAGA